MWSAYQNDFQKLDLAASEYTATVLAYPTIHCTVSCLSKLQMSCLWKNSKHSWIWLFYLYCKPNTLCISEDMLDVSSAIIRQKRSLINLSYRMFSTHIKHILQKLIFFCLSGPLKNIGFFHATITSYINFTTIIY